MTYNEDNIHENKFLPLESKKSFIFYGTKHLYIFLRFFYTLYERFFKAFEISNIFEENQQVEENLKTEYDRL